MGSHDLRFAVRNLLRTPGFTIVAVLTLALGIAANTAIFSVVNGVILKPLAYRDSGRLVFIQESVERFKDTYPTVPVNVHHYEEWRKQKGSFEELALLQRSEMNLLGRGYPERLPAARVSATFLPLLGVQPALGRNFLPEEDQPGRENVVLLSDGLWRRRFAADAGIVGRTLTVDGAAHTIAGVLPRGFRIPELTGGSSIQTGSGSREPQLFKPLAEDVRRVGWMGEFNYPCLGRLKPGATPERAAAELDGVLANIVNTYAEPGDKYATKSVIVPLQEKVVGKARKGLVVVLLSVGAVLLIVCVNLANLMLARTAARSREAAIRTALGAGRLQLMRHMMAESAVLAAAGGVLGIALAWGGLGALLRLAPANLPRLSGVTLDLRVLLFAIALAILSAVLAGAAPSWRLAKADPQDALRASGRSMTEGGRGVRLRTLLVALEVGLSTVLLIVAGLLMSSFAKLMQVDKGFNAERLMAVQIGLPGERYKQQEARAAFLDRVLPRISALPGVSTAAATSALPLRGETWVNVYTRAGDTNGMFERPSVNVRFVTPAYFSVAGVPLVRGRAFEDRDRGRRVLMISARSAEVLWPGEDPVGKRVTVFGEPKKLSEVVGVVADVRATLDEKAPLTAYVPHWEQARTTLFLMVRTGMDPRYAAQALRQAISQEDPEIAVPEMIPMEEVVSEASAQRRFQMWLIGIFAFAATALASLGIYGVISNTVARRTNELGIRMALGARAADVLGLVLRQGMAPVLAGLAGGIAAAIALARVLRSLLFEVSATDPRVMAAAVLVLAAVAAAACLMPARRAASISPLEALRYE
ncbi:MAG TPA: ABC transporter permease [Bryobacteraceae bacterium]|nr:ABC transporter permease [Bryobacteraceae bacterium]